MKQSLEALECVVKPVQNVVISRLLSGSTIDDHSCSKILLGRITPLITSTILPRRLLRSSRIVLEVLDLLTVHILGDIIRLPLLEIEAQALVAVVLVVGLIFMILDLDEVAVDCVWVERERDDGVDFCGLGEDLECP